MRSIRIILVSSFFGLIIGSSYGQCTHLNFILFVDNELATGYYDGLFKIKDDSLGTVTDSIHFHYEVGNLILTPNDLKRLNILKPDTKIEFSVNYRQTCPYEDLVYTIETTKHYLFQRYVIMKIYNYYKKLNQKDFIQKTGYGIEINIPGGGIILPRKKTTKHKRLDC